MGQANQLTISQFNQQRDVSFTDCSAQVSLACEEFGCRQQIRSCSFGLKSFTQNNPRLLYPGLLASIGPFQKPTQQDFADEADHESRERQSNNLRNHTDPIGAASTDSTFRQQIFQPLRQVLQ